MDKRWLTNLYEEVGLDGSQAEAAASETLARLVRRERPPSLDRRSSRSLIANFVRDPLVSMNRIIGRGDAGLPFYDEAEKKLNVVAFSDVLQTTGIDPVVALAYAKVIVEAVEPNDFFGPLWKALRQTGSIDLEALRCLDWTPLRAAFGVDATVSEQTAIAPTPKRQSGKRALGRRPSVAPPPKKK